jgi:xylulokinase
MECICGLDVGTSGAKALAVNDRGEVLARAEARFRHPPYTPAPGQSEQDAGQWWNAAKSCLRQLTGQLKEGQIVALSVDSTSGTIVPVGGQGKPLRPAMMYNDDRAGGLEKEVQRAAAELSERLGYTFPSVFSLVKLVWLRKEEPGVFEKTTKFLHAADFIVGKLTGNFDATDTSNALKSGVDLLSGTWPPFIERELGLPLSKFPTVFRPGEKLGEVSTNASGETGLHAGTPVIAGVSDGIASFLASGAKASGDWNLNLGTTLAIRGISEKLVRDSRGRFYCHRHPEGSWLPGGASNVGGEVLIKTFGEANLSSLDKAAEAYSPTSLLIYPLARRGERMPFVNPDAMGFVEGKAGSEDELYAGYLEGIALVTAWSIEEAKGLGAPADGDFFLSGGGARGKTLGRLIATTLGRPLIKTLEPEAALGSGLLAAGWLWFGGSVTQAQAMMVKRDEVFEPVLENEEPLRQKMERMKEACRLKGYL